MQWHVKNLQYHQHFFTETYTKALKRAKRAENTSNIETDLEGFKRRATKKPAKFDFSEDVEANGMTLFFT